MSRELEIWKGEFGDEYSKRNEITDENLAQRMTMWSGILSAPTVNTMYIDTIKILEVGANVGLNLLAIQKLMQRNYTLSAVEPNDSARLQLIRNVPSVNLVHGEASDISAITGQFDLVFTSGVLIHINDDDIKKAMNEIYRVSSKWILCIEYFSAEPVKKSYRGIDDLIYLRDYGSLWLDNFPLRCLGYAFCWKRITGIDNVTWWLFEKVN